MAKRQETNDGWAPSLVWIVLTWGFAAATLVSVWTEGLEIARLKREGLTKSAQLVQKRYVDGRHGSSFYLLVRTDPPWVRFSAGDARGPVRSQSYQVHQPGFTTIEVTPAVFRQAVVGDPFLVVQDLDHPEVVESKAVLEAWHPAWGALFWSLVGLLSSIIPIRRLWRFQKILART